MLYAGLDLAGQESYLYVVDGKGKRIKSCRVTTTPEALRKSLESFLKRGVCVAVEAGGNTRWVHAHLLSIGVRDVYVVNPSKMRLIAESRKKTDKVDAKLLAQMYRVDGLPRRVHMPSEAAAQIRTMIKARTSLVEARTKLMNAARGFLRSQGVRLPARHLLSPANWRKLIEHQGIDQATKQILKAYAGPIAELGAAIKEMDKKIAGQENQDDRIRLLRSMPGVGTHSATALVAAVDDIGRFRGPRQLASYCGLAPTVRASGDRHVTGHINRQGNSGVRRTWVQAAHAVVINRNLNAQPLQLWFERICHRRGYKSAIVALARKMITIAFYLLRDLTEYDPVRVKPV